jgi:hypothetical protein
MYYAQAAYIKSTWRKNLSVDITMSAHTVYENEKITLQQTVVNDKNMRLPWFVVKMSISGSMIFDDAKFHNDDRNYRNDLYSLKKKETAVREHEVRASKRGIYTFDDADFITYDVFHSRKFVEHVKFNEQLTVYPALIDLKEQNIPRGSRVLIVLDAVPITNRRLTDMFEETLRIASTVATRLLGQKSAVGIVSNIVHDAMVMDEDGNETQTRDCMNIAPKAEKEHLDYILSELSKVDIGDIHENVWQLYDRAVKLSSPDTIILISPDTSQENAARFDGMAREAAETRWIIPAFPREVTHIQESGKVTIWTI